MMTKRLFREEVYEKLRQTSNLDRGIEEALTQIVADGELQAAIRDYARRNEIFPTIFPKVMPRLTALQQQALELAIGQGYYRVPKKTNLRALAKLSGVSLATFQKHLQKAESKIIPDVLSFLK